MTKNILIVIDCQNDFITGTLRNEDAIKRIPNIVKKIREFKGDTIFYTMDTHKEDYLDTKEGQKLPVIHCVEGTEGWKIEANVQAAIDDAVLRNIPAVKIEKPTFGSYKLVDFIKAYKGYDLNIEIVGFCTDICVVSNAILLKTAFYDRANITVIEDCCAGVTPETHFAACKTMQMCQINIV